VGSTSSRAAGPEGNIEDIRNDPTPMGNIGLGDVVDHYEKIIHDLGRPVIIMGHSFGGLITQILLDRGQGAVGVAIDSAAPKGVFRVPVSEIRSGFPVLKSPANPIVRWRSPPRSFTTASGTL
jgi:pimeloyl-ACP methyl ester carboxylesterase